MPPDIDFRSDPQSEVIFRRLEIDEDGTNLFDRLTDNLEVIKDANLGANCFQKTFKRIEEKKRFVYVREPGGKTFSANIIAEVGSASEGTWLAAYPQKNPPTLPFRDDHSPHRMVIAARCPTGATPAMEKAYKSFLIALDSIRELDEQEEDEKGEVYRVTECTGREDMDKKKPADLIYLRLLPTYETPFGNRGISPPRRVRNRAEDEGDVEMGSATAAILARKVGDTYSPDMLPDHKGAYFAHEKAKLVQRPYKNEDGNLIAPYEVYSELREGTLFSAQVSLAFYHYPEKNPRFTESKIYHVNVDKLTVLDRGYGSVWSPEIPTMPGPSAPSTPKVTRVRQRDAAVDDAFDNLSPSKKARSA